jgi:hypothetical protein
METKKIMMCVVVLMLGMLIANMFQSVCGACVLEGNDVKNCHAITPSATDQWCNSNCNHNPANCPPTLCKCEGSHPTPTPAPPTPAPPTPAPPTPAPPTPPTPAPTKCGGKPNTCSQALTSQYDLTGNRQQVCGHIDIHKINGPENCKNYYDAYCNGCVEGDGSCVVSNDSPCSTQSKPFLMGGWEPSIYKSSWVGVVKNCSCLGYFSGEDGKRQILTKGSGTSHTTFITLGGVGTNGGNIPSGGVNGVKNVVESNKAKGIIYDFEGVMKNPSDAKKYINGIPEVWHIACPMGQGTGPLKSESGVTTGFKKSDGFTHIAPMMYGGPNSYKNGWTVDAINNCITQAMDLGYKKNEIFITFQSESISKEDTPTDVIKLLKSSEANGYAGILGWGSTDNSDNLASAVKLFN